MAWLLASKLEMTRIVKGNAFIPVTLLNVPKLKVVSVKTLGKDWYNSLVIGVLKEWKEWSLKEWKKSMSFSNEKFDDFSFIKEVPLSENEISKFNIWDEITLDILEWITEVNVLSYSKWKWFTWAMKKHNFSWGPATHGSKFHRALGSIGNRKPTRTHKWKKMHGHHWNTKINLKKVSVEIVNKDLSVLGLRWPIPGARKSLVVINF